MPKLENYFPSQHPITEAGLLLLVQTGTSLTAPIVGTYLEDAVSRSQFTRGFLAREASHIFGMGEKFALSGYPFGAVRLTPDLVEVKRRLSDGVMQFGKKNNIPVVLVGLLIGATLALILTQYIFGVPSLEKSKSDNSRLPLFLLAGSVLGGTTALATHRIACSVTKKVAWRFKNPFDAYTLTSQAVGASLAFVTWLYARSKLAD
ncbi:MAG: hypothetical protein HYT77_09935 [Deltaproteobacteria bacterium]|nr:hypothetical protein [Deltaproteobacteria bacterium]